jgi:AcrR family transcriptional regulator
MSLSPSISSCTRRTPCQPRGEKRVAALLAAAISEFATGGYETATMSSIAERARAPIGSLYQFFPNKEAVARAVRTRQIENVQMRLDELLPHATPETVSRFIERYVAVMIEFVDSHPAFLPLMDAPGSTQPIGARHALRRRLESILLLLKPGLPPVGASRMAEVVLSINRVFLTLYARVPPGEKRWVVGEYRALLLDYFDRKLGGREPALRRAGAAPPGRRKPTQEPGTRK